jgi:hypothetical protein
MKNYITIKQRQGLPNSISISPYDHRDDQAMVHFSSIHFSVFCHDLTAENLRELAAICITTADKLETPAAQ